MIDNYPNVHHFLGKEWLTRIIFYDDKGFFSYIGSFDELDKNLEVLQKVKGFGTLIGKQGLRSDDWEEIEHAFALTKEAARLKEKNLVIELFPEVTIRGETKVPDIKISSNFGDIYCEVKTSSMFPKEKEFLKLENKIKKIIEEAGLSDFILILSDRFSKDNMDSFSKWLNKITMVLKQKDHFPQKFSFPNQTIGLAHLISLGEINLCVDNNNELVIHINTVPLEKVETTYEYGQLVLGPKILIFGVSFMEYLKTVKSFLLESGFESLDDVSISYLILSVASQKGVIARRSSPYTVEGRLKTILDDAEEQIPPDKFNVVILYTREVILGVIEEILSTCNRIFSPYEFTRISKFVVNVSTSSREMQRGVFSNPFGFHEGGIDELFEKTFISK